MPQYPQGIYQSLQWLMKQFKILALQKQPTYTNISLASADYTIPGKGVYEITTASASTYKLIFPDPTLMNGMSITIINTDATNAQSISTTNQPYLRGTVSTRVTSMVAATYYQFVSINGKWRGGVLS